MKKILKFLISAVFPKTCSCCGEKLAFNSQSNICVSCFKSFCKLEGLTCKVCSMPLKDGGATCYDCKSKKNTYFNVLKSPYIYKGNIQKIIHKFKYSGRLFLSRDLSKPMIDLIYLENWDKLADIIVPVPLHFIKRFKRGYNQAYLLAEHISKKLNKPLYGDILVRKRYTRAQFSLGKKEREKNLENIFGVKEKYKETLKHKNILLVDDIATTCMTANQCSKALKQAKAGQIFVITAARAES